MKHDRIFDILTKIAIDIEPTSNARLAACLVKGSKIIAFGTNKLKTHPFQDNYKKNKHAVFLHAESDAIKNTVNRLRTDDLSKYSLYICRVKRDDENKNWVWGNSKPCTGCDACIKDHNIKKVFYTSGIDSYTQLCYNM